MLRDLPRRGWAGVAAAWARTAALALLYLQCGRVLDAALASEPRSAAQALGIGAGCAAAAMLCSHLAEAEPPRLQAREESRWRGRLIRTLLAAEPRDEARAGVEVSRLTDGVERAAAYRASFLGPTLAAFASPVLVLGVLALAVDPWTALVLAGIIALVPGVVALFMRVFRAPNARYRRLAAAAAGRFHEVLLALTTLRLLGAGRLGRERVAGAAEELRREVIGMLRRSQLMILVNDALFSIVMISLAALLALHRAGQGAVGPGGLLAALLLATLLHEPLERIGRSFYVGMGGRAQQAQLETALDAPPLFRDEARSGAAQPGPRNGAAQPGPRTPAALELRGLTAHRGEREVLHGLDVALPAGRTLAVVGPSGAGKSTLAAVLQGLLPASGGEVLLDGVPTARERLRRACRTVPQRPFLFTGSIAENLRLARPGASEALMWEALGAARLGPEVRRMPEGLGTPVGESGTALSGGQARRLGIARALLTDAPLLVLDEPTADLDRRTEELIGRTLRDLEGERTLVLITHRLETTRWAERVLVLDQGRQAAAGTPAELLSSEGYYRTAADSERARW